MHMRISPVIHIQSVEQAVEQALVVEQAGLNSVFLIDHNSNTHTLLLDCMRIIKTSTRMKVGVNFLAGTAYSNYLTVEGHAIVPDMIWVDDILGGTYPNQAVTGLQKLLDLKSSDSVMANILLYGGVAHKYTPTYTDNPEIAAYETVKWEPYLDHVVTTGPGTGKPLKLDKLIAMKNVTEKPVTVASGVDSSNIGSYVGVADEVLVSSSIETKKYSGVFVLSKLDELIAANQSTN